MKDRVEQVRKSIHDFNVIDQHIVLRKLASLGIVWGVAWEYFRGECMSDCSDIDVGWGTNRLIQSGLVRFVDSLNSDSSFAI